MTKNTPMRPNNNTIIPLAAGLLALSLPGTAQAQDPGTGVFTGTAQYSWIGSVNNDWLNKDNWEISGGSVDEQLPPFPNGPGITTYHWAHSKSKTIDLFTTGTVQVAELRRYDPDSGFALNMGSTSDTEWLTFDVTGMGFTRDSTASADWVARVTVGQNTRFLYSGTSAKGEQIYLDLRDNAVLDLRGNPLLGAKVTMRQMQAGPDTTIYLGEKMLDIGKQLNAGSGENVLAGTIIAESHPNFRGRLGKGYMGGNAAGGAGILRITGSNNFDRSPLQAGVTAVDNYYSFIENGRIVVESSLGHVRLGSTNLNCRIVLAGSGTVGNVLLQFGTISAGEGANEVKTGTLHVEGNLDITGGGSVNTGDVYAAGVFDTAIVADFGVKGAYDRVNVSGTTTIKGTNSTFRVYIPSGELYAGDYTVLQSNGGIIFEGATGFVNTILPSTLTLDFTGPFIDEGGTALKLKLTQKYFGDVVGLTPGQQNVAKFLDDLWADGTPGDSTSYDRLVGVMNGKTGFRTLTAAMNQLSGQAYSHLYTAAVAAMNHIGDKIEGRHGAPLIGNNPRKLNLYFAPSYDQVTVDPTADSEKANLKMLHYTVGATQSFSSAWTVDLAADFGTGDYKLDAQGSKADGDTLTGVASIGYKKNRYSAGALALYGWNSYKVKRSVASMRLAEYVTSDFSGDHWGFGAWVSYDKQYKWGSVKPYGKLYWMRWNADGFQEEGEEAVRLKVGGQSEDTLQSRVGFRIDSILNARNIKGGMLWRPFFDVSWVQQWAGAGRRDIDIVIIGRPMTAKTAKPDATGWRGSAGVSIDVSRRLTFELSASAQLGGMMDKQFGYNALLGWRF